MHIMLEKVSDNYDESSVKTINLNNVDTNASVNDSEKKSDEHAVNENFILENGLDNLNGTGEFCYTTQKTSGKYIIPDGYLELPEEFFKRKGIPPPLVSSSWLKLLQCDEESGEDSVPLAKLRKKIKKNKRSKMIEKSFSSVDREDAVDSKIKRKNIDNEYSPINRKRGRPKKGPIEITTVPVENEFLHEEESLWDNESDYSHHDNQNLKQVEFNRKSEENNVDSNLNDHDYFKRVDNAVVEEPAIEEKEENKKKRKAYIHSMKTRDFKASFPCLECGKSFSASSTLKSHQRIHNGTLLICPECHKGFISKYLLKCHMRIHNGDLLMCHKCGRGFTTAELLKVHSRAHTGDRPFICNICGKSFPTSSNMQQHKQIHDSEKKYLCSECGSSFVQKRCLDYHMLTHAEKKNICNVCGKLWARKSDLIEHMRVHTGVKPYCCSICPQKFSQASSLKRHQLVHVDDKPISCVTCNKMFKCQEYYKRHLRKHEKEDYAFNDI